MTILQHANFLGQEYKNLNIFYRNDDFKTNYEQIAKYFNTTGRSRPETYCRHFNNCIECTSGTLYPCSWCHDIGCVSETERACKLRYSSNLSTNSSTQDIRCPFISHTGPILLPADVRTNIKVKIFSPDPVIYEKEIVCEINFKQKYIHLKGMIVKNIVHCYPVQLNVKRNGDIETGLLRVLWDGIDPHSNVLPVVVYTCENLAQDCDSCRTIPPEYGCGWCDIYNACILGDKCINNFVKWALNRLSCDAFNRKLYYV